MSSAHPVSGSDRLVILDILRGIALLGIIVANYPSFSGFIFMDVKELSTMPTWNTDRLVGFFHFTFIDGKFYTVFSLLFGIGFSIILFRNTAKGLNPMPIFYRRIGILLIIGLLHSLLLWEGDILVLYALMGMLLPLFIRSSDRKLITIAIILLLSPIVIDVLNLVSDNAINISIPLEELGESMDEDIGITDENVYRWRLDNPTYSDILDWNISGFVWRWQYLLESPRPMKVLGVFCLGFVAVRRRLFFDIQKHKKFFASILKYGLIMGLPMALARDYFIFGNHAIPAWGGIGETVCYAFSVVPLGLAYVAAVTLLLLKYPRSRLLLAFAPAGRMALTNYLLQSVFGIVIFYGIGFGLGGNTGASIVLIISLGIFGLQMIMSHIWLKYFRFGPVEYIWRILTYGHGVPLRLSSKIQ